MRSARVPGVIGLVVALSAATFPLSSCDERKPATLEEIAARALSYTDSEDKAAVVQGINGFCLDLYARLAASEEGNILFSPFSISTALAMAYAGAREGTATEMAAVLHWGLTQDELPAAFGALLDDMEAVGERDGYVLAAANSLWGQKGFEIVQSFLDVLEDSYGAPLEEVDFESDAEQARSDINDWVADRTENRIEELLGEGTVDSTTRLVLANALYFKGTWARMFAEEDTTEGSFELQDGTMVTVPMMSQTAELGFMENDLLSMLELPYTTGDLSMLIILPKTGLTLGDLEESLTADNLEAWSSALEGCSELDVTIPRFSFTASFRLAEQLAAMGMGDAFTSAADFSGITTSADLAIGDVFHKAFIEVNEEGTEATAATAVTIGETAAGPGFVADRPFLFLIRHSKSGAILFLGRLADPGS